MDFLIRSNSPREIGYREKQDRYIEFLHTYDAEYAPDLFAYFAYDFFHDGEITTMNFQDDMRLLYMRISCPNIKRNEPDGTSSYIEAIWFHCFFQNISSFRMEARKIDSSNNPLSEERNSIRFLEAEINSLTDEIAHYSSLYGNDFFSLIVKTLPVQRDFSVIFTQLIVEPEEPAGFELLKHSSNYTVPLFP